MRRAKVMAILLSAAMVMSTPATAFAAEQTEETEVLEETQGTPEGTVLEDVIPEGEVFEELVPEEEPEVYGEADEAVKVVEVNGELKDAYLYTNETLKLVSDSTASGFTTWGQHTDLKIDLNGHTLTLTGELGVGWDTHMTFMDSAGGGKMVHTENLNISNGGTLLITGGSYDTDLRAYMQAGLFFNDNGDGTFTVSDTEKEKEPEKPVITDGVASVGDVQFETLQDAVNAIETSGTVKLLKNVDLTNEGLVIPEGKTVTLDLAEVNKDSSDIPYAILAEPTATGHIAVYGNLTLTDSDMHVSHIISATKGSAGDYSVIDVYGNGTLNLHRIYMLANGNDQSISGVHGTNAIGVHDNAELIVDADVQDNYAIVNSINESVVRLFNSATMTFKQGCIWNLGDGAAIEVNDNAVVNMTGGFIRSGGLTSDKNDPENATNWDGGTPVIMNGGTFNMSGGRIRSDVTGTNFEKSGDAVVRVSGGYLKQQLLAEDCAEGYRPVKEDISESGEITTYYTVTDEEQTPATILAANVNFKGTIGLNYYIEFPEEILEDSGAYLSYEFVKDTVEVTEVKISELANSTRRGKACKLLTINVVPRTIHDNIILTVYDGAGNLIPVSGTGWSARDSFTYSVARYCADIKAQSSNTAMINLADKLEQYGAYVQKYLDYKADQAVTNLDFSGVTADVLNAYKGSWVGKLDGITFSAFSFVFKEDSAIRFKFKVSEGTIDDYTFTVDGKKLVPGQQGTQYYVEIGEIRARDLGTPYTLTVSDKNGNTMNLSYSGISYAQMLEAQSTNENAKNVSKALYLYYQAALAYFNS